jgi:hypothetical protein
LIDVGFLAAIGGGTTSPERTKNDKPKQGGHLLPVWEDAKALLR